MSPCSRLFSTSIVWIHSGFSMSDEIGRKSMMMGYNLCLKCVGMSRTARNWLAMFSDLIHLADSTLSSSTISPLFLSLVMALICIVGLLSSWMLLMISASLLEFLCLGCHSSIGSDLLVGPVVPGIL